MNRVDLGPVDHHLIVQVRSCRQACISDISDELATLYHLTFTNDESVHVGITSPISKAVVDFHHLTIATEAHLCVVDFAICCSVDRSTDSRREINTSVHLLHLVDGVNAKPESRGKRDEFFI